MLTYLEPRQAGRHRDGGRECVDIIRRDETTGSFGNELGYAPAAESDNWCAATHRLGDDQSVRFVPHRGDQCDGRGSDEARKVTLGEVSGVVHLRAEMRLYTLGVVSRIGDRARQGDGTSSATRGFDRKMRRLFGGDPSEPHDAFAARA